MKVTKLIKEYIVEQIEDKYKIALDQVSKEYNDTYKEYSNEIKTLEAETTAKAKEIAAKYNLKYPENSFHRTVTISTNASNEEKHKQQMELEGQLYKKKQSAIKDILVGLELGDTTKEELKSIIENVSF